MIRKTIICIFFLIMLACKAEPYSRLYFIDYNLYVWSYMRCALNNSNYDYYNRDIRGDLNIKFENGMILESKDNNLFFSGKRIAVEKDYRNISIDTDGIHYYAYILIAK